MEGRKLVKDGDQGLGSSLGSCKKKLSVNVIIFCWLDCAVHKEYINMKEKVVEISHQCEAFAIMYKVLDPTSKIQKENSAKKEDT